MRKITVLMALMCAIVSIPLLAGCGSSEPAEKDYTNFYKSFSVNLENYVVEATCTAENGNTFFVSSVVAGNNAGASAMQITTTGKNTSNGFVETKAIISDEFSQVETHASNDDPKSFYCKGNLVDENLSNGIIIGTKLYQLIQNAIENSVYSEYKSATTVGDVVRIIYKADTDAEVKESHFLVYLDGEGNPVQVELPCVINGHSFTVRLDMRGIEAIQMDRNTSTYTEKYDLQNYYAGMMNYTNDFVFNSAAPIPEPDPGVEPEPTPEPEPETTEEPEPEQPAEDVPAEPNISENELITLQSAKDMFIKLTFSNFVDEVEFVSPTGGSYKPESGNVEKMLDSEGSLTAYYRIPNAEMGKWMMRVNTDNNPQIDFNVYTDNKIKINGLTMSDIKDGIISAEADLSFDKGLDLNYEYKISIVDENNNVSTSTNGIVNTKDPAKYNISLMDLPAGNYRAQLRIEYMMDGQKYFNMFTSNTFTKGE